MKIIIFIAIIAFVGAEPDYYELEELEISELIKDLKAFKKFIDCVMAREECTRYGSYKAITQEAVEQACKRCSPSQKRNYYLFLEALKTSFPNDYSDYRKKYDPENKYFDALEEELWKYSIKH